MASPESAVGGGHPSVTKRTISFLLSVHDGVIETDKSIDVLNTNRLIKYTTSVHSLCS